MSTSATTDQPFTPMTGAVQRTIAAVCLMLGPVAFAIAEFASPEADATDPAAMLPAYAAHASGVTTSIVASLASAFLLLAGLSVLVANRRIRSRALVPTGMALVLWSMLANTLLLGVNAVFLAMSDPALDGSAMAAAVSRTTASPIAPLALTGHYVLVLGLLVLGIAFWRSGVGPRWAAVAIASCGVVDAVGGALGPSGELVGGIVSNALFIAGFAAQGWFLLREPRHTPASVESAHEVLVG